MPDYKYKYSVDDNTQNQLTQLTETGWIEIFKTVLDDKSIDYNIDFSEFEPKTRLCTLYSVLITKNIDTVNYQKALVNLTYEIYPIAEKNYFSFILIQVIDYVRPSAFFQRLSLLVINPSYSYMMEVRAPNGLLLHLYLVNTIMHFDADFAIYNYLKKISKTANKHSPEYHQVLLRYIYSYCEEYEFSAHLIEVFPQLKDDKINRLVTLTLKEYVFVKHSFRFIYQWLNTSHKQLKAIDNSTFNNLIDFLDRWTAKDGFNLSKNEFFLETKELINTLKTERTIDSPTSITETINSIRARLRKISQTPFANLQIKYKSELPLLSGKKSIADSSDEQMENLKKENLEMYSKEVEATKQLSREDFLIPENEQTPSY